MKKEIKNVILITMNTASLIKKHKIEEFIKKIKLDLSKHHGKLILKPVRINNDCFDGEFSESQMTIKCLVDPASTYWIGVLAHEYAHFLQCTENHPSWENFQKDIIDIDDVEQILQNNNKISKRIRKKICPSIVKMELECDKMAINLIDKYKLPVEKKEYCAKANVVLYKYLFWQEYGIWPNLNSYEKHNAETDFKNLCASRLFHEDKYKSIDDIPKKIFYLFKSNKSN